MPSIAMSSTLLTRGPVAVSRLKRPSSRVTARRHGPTSIRPIDVSRWSRSAALSRRGRLVSTPGAIADPEPPSSSTSTTAVVVDAPDVGAHGSGVAPSPPQPSRTVVVGGGPTGVEFAAELVDYIRSDLSNLYDEARNARVTLIQSADHILNTVRGIR